MTGMGGIGRRRCPRVQVAQEGAQDARLEEFRGLLVPLVMRGRMLAATREMFAVFNAKLKARVESL